MRLFDRSPRRRKSRLTRSPARRLLLEPLEDRTLLATLSGFVFIDTNGNGVRDESVDAALPGVVIELSEAGVSNAPALQAMSDNADSYSFVDLAPGNYSTRERHPAPFQDGGDAAGTPGDSASNDLITINNLAASDTRANNNFGELNVLATFITKRLFLNTSIQDAYRNLNADSAAQAGEPQLADRMRTRSIPSVVSGNGTGVTDPIETSNRPPTFVIPSATHTSNEDAGIQTIADFLTNISPGPNESSQSVTSIVAQQLSSSNSNLFAVAPAISTTGTLTYTAAPNQFGTATFAVTAMDNGGTANGGIDTSSQQLITIVVNSVGDAPSFTIAQPAHSSLEDGGLQSVPEFANQIQAAAGHTESIVFNLTPISGNAASLFSAGPAISSNGTLTYTASANAFGSVSFNVTAQHEGVAEQSDIRVLSIEVLPINDRPTFNVPTPTASSDEDAGQVTHIPHMSLG